MFQASVSWGWGYQYSCLEVLLIRSQNRKEFSLLLITFSVITHVNTLQNAPTYNNHYGIDTLMEYKHFSSKP